MVYETSELTLIKLPTGNSGIDGKTLYTWVKYADDNIGTGMSDDPDGKRYLGLAYNKESIIESNIASDYTWIKVQGESNSTLTLLASSQVVSYTNLGEVKDSTLITLTALLQNSSEELVWETTPNVTLGGTGYSRTFDPKSFGSITANNVRIKVRTASDSLFDYITIYKVKDGTDGTSVKILGTKNNSSELPTDYTGEIGDGYIIDKDLWVWTSTGWTDVGTIQGKDGVDGFSAYTLILGNENHSFTGSLGIVEESTISCEVIGLLGDDRQVTSITESNITGKPTGMEITVMSNNTKNTYLKIDVTSTLATYNGTVTIPITIGSLTINKVFTYSVIFNGKDGEDSILITSSNELISFSANSSNNVVELQSYDVEFTAYKGEEKPTVIVGTLPTVDGLSLTKVNVSTVRVLALIGSALVANGVIPIPMTVNGTAYTKNITWLKVNNGVEDDVVSGMIDAKISLVEEGILSTVKETCVDNDDYLAFKEVVSTSFLQSSKEFLMKFDEVKEYANDVNGQTQTQVDEIHSYIRNSADGIEIGKENSDFKSNFSSTSLTFSEGTNVIAEIKEGAFYGKTSVHVEDELKVGTSSKGVFKWVVTDSGHFSLKVGE